MTAVKNDVLTYLATKKIPVVDDNVILIGIQASCKMATVELNGECLMMGNYWDFYNGCHGMKIPEFSSYSELANIISKALVNAGKTVRVETDKSWRYDEDEDE